MTLSLRHCVLLFLVACSMAHPLRAETPLCSEMDTMKGAMRSLRAALQAPADADKDKYTGFAETLITAATKAREFDPEMTSTIPEAERARFLADYRKSIDNLIGLLNQLKTQLAAGDWESARAQMRLINDAQADGHEKFRVEEF